MSCDPADPIVRTCASPLFAAASALFTVSLALNLAACPTVPFAVVQIPLALICLGMWLTFAAARRARPSKGPGIVQAGISIALFASLLPFFLSFILGQGFFNIGYVEEDRSSIMRGFVIMVATVVAMGFVIMFWNQPRRAAETVGRRLRGVEKPWPKTLYTMVLLVVFAAGLCWLPFGFGGVVGALREALAVLDEVAVPIVEDALPQASAVVAQVDAALAALPGTLSGLALAGCFASAASLSGAVALLAQLRRANIWGQDPND